MRSKFAAFPLTALSHKPTHLNDLASHSSEQSFLHHAPVDSDEAESTHYEPTFKPWTPLMLQRWVLQTISIVLLALIVSLEIVLKISTDRHGFGPVGSSLHYVWTYGPTAVFTLIAAFWTQVDYRTRQMQPWKELAEKPQLSSTTLFLDYISPHPVASFLASLKHRHWSASAALSGSILLKIVIVLSTGLFAPQFSNIPVPAQADMIEQFDLDTFNMTDVDDVAGSLYTGLLLKQIDYPQGTNADFAVEMFKPSRSIDNTYSLTADVRSLTGKLECELAQMDREVQLQCPTGTSCRNDWVTMSAETQDCRIPSFPTNNRTLMVTSASEANLGPQDKFDYGSWYGDAFLERCDGNDATTDRDRIVIVSLYKDPGPILTNSTTLFCKPSIIIQQSTITIDHLGRISSMNDSIPLQAAYKLTAAQISNAMRTSVDWLPFNREGTEIYGNNTRKYSFRPFVRLLLQSQNSTSIDDASNFELLARGADTVYRGLAVQLAKQYLLVANSTTPSHDLNIRLSQNHQRLFVQLRPLRILECILGILILISLGLSLRPPKHHIPQDTVSIARLSSAISRSNELNNELSSTGSWPLRSLQNLLQGTYHSRFMTAVEEPRATSCEFVIEAHGSTGVQSTHTMQRYWQPLMLSWYTRLALLVLPLGLIIALEIVFQQSRRHTGLLDISETKQAQIGTTYVPALIMALTKLLYSSFDFDLRIIDPYVQLKRGSAAAKASILDRTIYTWKTDAFWIAMKNRRFSVGASALSVMMASFLTVAVSGLFVTTPVARESILNLTRLDEFSNTTQVFRLSNESTARASRLAAYGILDSSIGSFGPYIVPRMSLSLPKPDALNITSVEVQTPVRKGTLNCSLVSPETVNVIYSPRGAPNVDLNWPGIMANCTGAWYLDQPVTSMYDLVDGPFGKWDSSVVDDSLACPTSWGMYGTWMGNRITDLNIVQCWSAVQEAQATVRLSLPSWKIQSLSIREKTERTIATGLKSQLLLPLIFKDKSAGSNSSLLPPDPPFDGPFSSFLRRPDSKVLDTQLVQRDKFDELYARIQNVYGLVVAQTITLQGRNTTLATETPILKGTATVYTVRLQQNVVSTRILQGLLACMAICALFLVCTLRLSKVLPKNPCSIAAQASLVAGSKMLARLPLQAQWMKDREFEALFKNDKYKMGWSIGYDGKERFGIDIDEDSSETREGQPLSGEVGHA